MIEFEANKMEGGFLVPGHTEWPINKWQAFKERHFPYWLKRIFPVKTMAFPMAEYILELLARKDNNGKK